MAVQAHSCGYICTMDGMPGHGRADLGLMYAQRTKSSVEETDPKFANMHQAAGTITYSYEVVARAPPLVKHANHPQLRQKSPKDKYDRQWGQKERKQLRVRQMICVMHDGFFRSCGSHTTAKAMQQQGRAGPGSSAPPQSPYSPPAPATARLVWGRRGHSTLE